MTDVPGRYRGVWSRTLLETPEGRDTTTYVRWLQTARWHADLRVPLAAREREGPAALALQQGFCGVTEVRMGAFHEACTWQRRFDFQPPGLNPDAGRMVFETPDRVIETGVHGVYREVWERLPGSGGRSIALVRPDGLARVLVAGRYLMHVRPRESAWPGDVALGESLAEWLARAPALAGAALDFEISFGVFEAGHWTIEHATLPELEGQSEAMAICLDGAHVASIAGGRLAGLWDVLSWQ